MFAVIYRWKIKPGKETEFQRVWGLLTQEFKTVHGALGSCLHQAEDGTWLAYARWPSRELWEKAKDIRDQSSLDMMQECTAERLPHLAMSVTKDLLF